MSFFNNQKNAGIALVVCAILLMLAAIVLIADQFLGDKEVEYATIVVAIGSIVGAFLYFGFGKSVMDAELNDKFDIVCKFVQVYGYVQIVAGIFYLISAVFNNDYVGNGIVSLILGLIVLFIYKKITDGNVTLFDKIVWIVLLIVFLLTIIAGIALLFAIITIPVGIAYMIIGIFMMMAILDNDVKAKFGM